MPFLLNLIVSYETFVDIIILIASYKLFTGNVVVKETKKIHNSLKCFVSLFRYSSYIINRFNLECHNLEKV